MDCKNVIPCPCTYPCSRRGKCCECVAYHRKHGQFPGCLYSVEAEKTYDRSLERLVRDRKY